MSNKVLELVDNVREAVSCCCSEHRYREINKLCDSIKNEVEDTQVMCNFCKVEKTGDVGYVCTIPQCPARK